jgi:hypothetical protein
MDSMNYAFYDPELEKRLQMTLQINKNDPEIGESFSDRDDFWY